MKTIIHVNQHNIRHNHRKKSIKKGDVRPVLTVKTYKSNIRCNEVSLLGPSKVIYSPDKSLACGARVWVETEDEVIIVS